MSLPDYPFWGRMLAIGGGEVLVVLLLAWAAQRMTTSVFWKRTFWRSAFLGVLLLTVAEFSGLSRGVGQWLRSSPPAVAARQIRMTTAPLSLSSAESVGHVSWEPWPETTAVMAKAESEPAAVWWPGGIWAVGLVFWGGRMLLGWARAEFWRWRKPEAGEAGLPAAFARLAKRYGLGGKVMVRVAPQIKAPVALGVFRRAILLPADFTGKFTEAEQEAMLAHELSHLAARDPFWYALADLARVLFWWHPAVWWARRQLHFTSEMAADETAAAAGPVAAVLAETLVTLARADLGQDARWGLGVTGGGFRSQLAQRVERLLHLPAASGGPARRSLMTAMHLLLPVLLLGLVGPTCGWMQSGPSRAATWQENWRNARDESFLSTLLLAATLPEREDANGTVPPPLQAQEPLLRTLSPRTETNGTGGSIQTELPAPTPAPVANEDAVTAARYGLATSLKNAVPAEKPVKKIFELNPDKLGVSIESPESEWVPALQQRIGAQATLLPPEQVSVFTIGGHVFAMVSVTAENMPKLEGFLRPMLVEFEENFPGKEVFPPAAVPLQTRTYRVNSEAFLAALKKMETSTGTNATQSVREFFKMSGTDLAAPESVYFNDRNGLLLVRATAAHQESAEKTIVFLNEAPAQIHVQAKFIQIDEALFSPQELARVWREVGGAFSTNRAGALSLTNNALLQSAQAKSTVLWTNALDASLTSVLNDPQTRLLLKLLKGRKGVEILTSPEVTTLSGRQAQMSVMEMRTLVTGVSGKSRPGGESEVNFDTQPMPFGQSLDIIPRMEADGHFVNLTMIGMDSSFAGYDDPGRSLQNAADTTLPGRATFPLPRYYLRQMSGNAIVGDGQTAVLTGLTQTVPEKRKSIFGPAKFSSKAEKRTTLIILVTPTLIDEAGNRTHREEDRPVRASTTGNSPKK